MAFVIDQRFEKTDHHYDREGDVLYLSFGPPIPAISLVLEDWLVLRITPGVPRLVGMTLIGFKKLFSKVRPDLIKELPTRVERLKQACFFIGYSDDSDTLTFRFEDGQPAYYERFGENIYLERTIVDGHISGLKITQYTERGESALKEVLTSILDSLFALPGTISPADALTRAFFEHVDLPRLLALAA